MIILNGLQCLIFLFCLCFNSLVLADTKAPSTNPIYCQRGECLYCDETGYMVIPTDTHVSATMDNTGELSTSQLNDALADLQTVALSSSANEFVTLSKNQAQEKAKEAMSRVKKVSHKYATKIKKNSNTTYQRLKSKNQQMINEQVIKQQPMRKVEPVYHYKANANPSMSIPYKNHSTKQKSTKKSNPTAPIQAAINYFHYKPTIDFAQYALHQGNSRSGNLIEGFIPLGEFTFDQVIFLDLRYYNPNGTPFEWNADLAFRQFSRANFLWGIYGGYDRMRSQTSRYFGQCHAGLEFWFNRLFLGGNVYIPVGTKEYDNIDIFGYALLVPTDIPYQYNIALSDQHDERILEGGDAEIGFDITRGLTVYAGGYYFHHAGFSTVTGPKLRATYTLYRSDSHRLLALFDRIRLEGLVTHDKPRGTSWLVGLRFTLGLNQQPNPTHGVIRHMVDPLRRDFNIISQPVFSEDLLRDSAGNPVNVDVADGSTITVRDAIDDATAEVVGVVGAQSLTSPNTLTVGGHQLTISGQNYNFSYNNHNYTVQVGNTGNITQEASASAPLITMDGLEAVTITQLDLMANNTSNITAIKIDDATTTLGKLTVNQVTSNATFDANVATGAATIAFDYNTFSTSSNSMPAVSLSVSGSGALTVTSFTHNALTTSGQNSNGIINKATAAGGSIIYTGSFTSNIINTNTASIGTDIHTNATGVYNHATNSSSITFNQPFSYNIIITNLADYANGISAIAESGGNITYNSFSYNTITTGGLTVSAGGKDQTGVLNYADTGNIRYTGEFSHNIITTNTSTSGGGASGGDNSAGLYNYSAPAGSSIQFDGNISYNTIISNSSFAFAFASYITDTANITYNGTIRRNNLVTFGDNAPAMYTYAIDPSSNITFKSGVIGNSAITYGTNSNGMDTESTNEAIITFLVGITDNILIAPSPSYGIALGSVEEITVGNINIHGASSIENLSAINNSAEWVIVYLPNIYWYP